MNDKHSTHSDQNAHDDAHGWLQDGSLLYRLTDGPDPRNRDEIHVTQADGSRTEAKRAARATQILALLKQDERYAAAEREHFGDPDKRTGIYAPKAAEPYKLQFPTMLRKMWSGCEVQAWLDALPPLYASERVDFGGHRITAADFDAWAGQEGRERAAAQSAGQEAVAWVSVKDRMPEPWRLVALLDESRWMNTGNEEFNANWAAAGWLVSNDGRSDYWAVIGERRAMSLDSVTHWMPLPASTEAAPVNGGERAGYDGNHVENRCPECNEFESDCLCSADAQQVGGERWLKQTTFYDGAPGSGNCAEACVASLFAVPLDEVQKFYRYTDGAAGYWARFSEEFEKRGYEIVMMEGNRVFDGMYLADGPSSRGCSHMVVMRNGELLHDPHPSGEGLLSIKAVHVPVPLDPARAALTPPAKVGGYEREAFEVWARGADLHGRDMHLDAWGAWQARAALSAGDGSTLAQQKIAFLKADGALPAGVMLRKGNRIALVTEQARVEWFDANEFGGIQLSADGGDRKDAEMWRFLREQHEGTESFEDAEGFTVTEPTARAFTVFKPGKDFHLEPVGCMPGELDATIAAAIAAKAKGE